MRTTVRLRKDTKKWKRIKKNLKKDDGVNAEIGWFSGRHSRTKATLAQIAKWNEEGHYNGGAFGGTITPPRPFVKTALRKWFHNQENRNTILREYSRIASGATTRGAMMKRVGESIKEAIQQSILDTKSPVNKPSTIGKKGFNDPLIETGSMYDGIRVKIRRNIVD